MQPRRLAPPRWSRRVALAAWIACALTGVAMASAALDPEAQARGFLVATGVVFAVVPGRAAVRNHRVGVVLDDTTLHVHGWLWSRRVPRDRITAVWDPGQVQFDGDRGVPETVWITWLMRNGPDDDATVFGRLQRPWREATTEIREWAGVTNAL